MKKWMVFLWTLGLSAGVSEAVVIRVTDFDSGTPQWNYTSDLAFFDNGADGFYGVTGTAGPGLGFGVITSLNDNFLGVRDLDDEGDFGGPKATLTFDNIAVSAYENVQISFDWQYYQWDSSEKLTYEYVVDGVGQGAMSIVPTATDTSASGSVASGLFSGINTLGLVITIAQNGASDWGGLDNFLLSGDSLSAVPEPGTAWPLVVLAVATFVAQRQKMGRGLARA